MIVDSFDYIACYKGLHPNLDKAIDWLNSHTLDALENGKTIIDGENVFVNVMDADLREADGAAFEYHRRYADLQIDLTGSEHWGWASEGKDEARSTKPPTAASSPVPSTSAAFWAADGLPSSSPASCTSPAAKAKAVTT